MKSLKPARWFEFVQSCIHLLSTMVDSYGNSICKQRAVGEMPHAQSTWPNETAALGVMWHQAFFPYAALRPSSDKCKACWKRPGISRRLWIDRVHTASVNMYKCLETGNLGNWDEDPSAEGSLIWSAKSSNHPKSIIYHFDLWIFQTSWSRALLPLQLNRLHPHLQAMTSTMSRMAIAQHA